MFAVEVYGILQINNQLNNAGTVLFIRKPVMSIRGIVSAKG